MRILFANDNVNGAAHLNAHFLVALVPMETTFRALACEHVVQGRGYGLFFSFHKSLSSALREGDS